jgi:hypothetical protein
MPLELDGRSPMADGEIRFGSAPRSFFGPSSSDDDEPTLSAGVTSELPAVCMTRREEDMVGTLFNSISRNGLVPSLSDENCNTEDVGAEPSGEPSSLFFDKKPAWNRFGRGLFSVAW